ncbi:hypothetical protein PI124_g125 [Phytophthora idaei]|nr:hypothetical protein PI125_g17994 [Phytophthora idaei]KAG3137914.1 hypothetical protein PI126_g17165 [Phytophthora idaei]KAG3255285.1 hypothetical protein PI124_g125 [Phytophthora idaei]
MLTKNTPDLGDIVVFGSPCTVHVDAESKSLGERGKPGMIVGKSDEIKGYRVYIPRDKVVVVTQSVSNVETLSDVRNEQLQRVHLDDSEESSEKKTSGKPKRKSKRHGKKTGWTRDKRQMRASTRKAAEANASQEAGGEQAGTPTDVVNSVRELDSKNYRLAIRSRLKKKCHMAITDELRALEENGV